MRTKFEVTLADSATGYDISIGIGKKFRARDLQEVVYGLQHYFRQSIAQYPYDYQKHIEHAKVCDCCPLCRESK